MTGPPTPPARLVVLSVGLPMDNEPLEGDGHPVEVGGAVGQHVVLDPIGDGWVVAYYVDTRDQAPAVVEMRIVPLPEGDDLAELGVDLMAQMPTRRPRLPLTARAIQRQVKPSRALAEFKQGLDQFSDAALARLGIARDMLATAPDRARKDDRTRLRHLANVALLYVEAVERGSKRPIRDVQEWLNEQLGYAAYQKPEAVRDLLAQARREELLKRPGQGVTQGAALTDKGWKAARAVMEPWEGHRRG